MDLKKIWRLIRETLAEWSEDKAARLAAALAYYTIFSIPPLLVIGIAIAGQLFGREAAQQEVLNQIGGIVGADGRQAVESILDNVRRPQGNTLAIIFGVVILFLGASGVFAQLQDGLNTVWDVTPKPGQGLIQIIKIRFLSFTMVLGTGFLLLVSLIISALLGLLAEYLSNLFPGVPLLLQILNFLVSFGVITVLFALIFRTVPDVEIKWRDVWIGALITAFLFTAGKIALSLYLQYSDPTSVYGAAGSLILIALWVYYSAQILFLGAEFTQVYTNRHETHLQPTPNAVFVTEEARAKQGIPSEETKQEATQLADQSKE
jgi:membrane protein